MNHILLTTTCMAACLAPMLSGYTSFTHTDPMCPLAGEVQPAQLFDTVKEETRLRILQALGPEEAARIAKLKYHLEHPEDDELFCELIKRNLDNTHIEAYAQSFCTPAELTEALPLLRFRHLYKNREANASMELQPGREFVLKLRDMFRDYRTPEEIYEGMLILLQDIDTYSLDELYLLNETLKHYCQGKGCKKIFAAAMKLQLQDFKGAKHIEISEKEEAKLVQFDERFLRFLHAEKALRGTVCRRQPKNMHPHCRLMFSMIWRDTDATVILARTINNPGFELLRSTPDALHDYMKYKGVTLYGINGYDVPECCLTALNPHAYPSIEKAFETVLLQAAAMPPHMQALIPRCILAVGGGGSAWVPVNVTPLGVCPFWPDASAVQLPQWQPKLLGLADDALPTVQAAYDADFAELEKLLGAARRHGIADMLLAKQLEECRVARPHYDALKLPVYTRIALHFEEDGVLVDYTEENTQIRHTQKDSTPAVAEEVLCNVPQHMHRITLQLALLEKHGHTAALQQACERLAKLLNKHNLWPLLICQRELRGFSTRALLTLFEHYEGEADPLFDYGEALGLRYEMCIARLGHEDDLGLNLLRAAYISRALPATDAERDAAVTAFMNLAKKHAADASPQLTGTILLHLTRWGVTAPVLQWQDCPSIYLGGEFSGVGLQLIRALMSDGKRTEAEAILAKMAEHDETDTTPAYREAMALLATDPAEAQRFQHDALLLAMWRLRVNYEEYCAYREDQAAHGTQYENMMKGDLIHSWGRTAGITPALALRFAREGMWEEAVFAYEYLLTDGLSNATPYGLIPDHAHICYYRAFADICRSKMTGNRTLAARALYAVKGTPAEKNAFLLNSIDKQKTPATVTTHTPPPQVAPVVVDDSFRHWKWKMSNTSGPHYSEIQGKLLKAVKDTDAKYPDDYIVSVLKPDGTIRFLRTFGMPAEQRKEVLEFCNNPANQTSKPKHAGFAW